MFCKKRIVQSIRTAKLLVAFPQAKKLKNNYAIEIAFILF